MDSIALNFVTELAIGYPAEFALAQRASDRVIAATADQDFSALERHSPALKGFDWATYLRLSAIRMVKALRLVRESVKRGGRILDYGSYFGNFSLMLAEAGYRVTALDSYDTYGKCFAEVLNLLAQYDVEVVNSLESEPFASRTAGFDVVLLMGVIEHVAHTPRLLLENVRKVVAPEGLLILDTPNLAYLYTRQRLARGESIFAPIQSQYWTDMPFEGHHREYTKSEVEWMLGAAGFSVCSFEAFNYSIYGLSQLTRGDLENYRMMERDPSMRELLMFAARPAADWVC